MSRKTFGNTRLKIAVLVSLTLAGCVGQGGNRQDTLLQSRVGLPDPLASKVIRVTDIPVLGNRDAALALIEVTDYQCPFCQTHYRNTMPQLKEEFIDSGQLSYYVIAYPLTGHEFAAQAAVAASCASDQQVYWQYHDALFTQSTSRNQAGLLAVADSLSLDMQSFEFCLENRQRDTFLERQRSTALGLGIQGTPTFLLGRQRDGRLVTDIAVLPGLQTMEYFREVIGRYNNNGQVGS